MTPLVRKLAIENGIDLATVKGTGVGGRIRKQDVLAAAEAKKAPAADGARAPAAAPAARRPRRLRRPPLAHLRGTTQKANRIRQITAKKTRESLQTTAQLTQTHEVDMTKIVALRARAKNDFAEREGVNLTYLPFIARAVIDALKAHPNINASYNEDTKEITYYDAEHLGFAVDTEQGLLSPVIHNAGDLSLAGLARAIPDIADRARSGDLKPDELSGGTFTITNIGSQGALFDTPILVPPQAAMLGTGAIVKRPRVIVDEFGNESIGVRSICYLPLTYDHRLIDGADAGRFLTTDQAAARRRGVRGRPGAVTPWAARAVVAIAGSSGLIGSALVVGAARRRPPGAAHRAPGAGQLRRAALESRQRRVRPDALEGVDAVVNLCGVNVGEKRWSGAFKQSLRDSRIGPTEVMSAAVADAGVRRTDQRQRGRLLRRHPRPGRRRNRPSRHGFPGPAVRRLGVRDAARRGRRRPRGAGPHRAGALPRRRCAGSAAAAVRPGPGRPAGQRPAVHAVDQPRGRGPRAAVRDQQRRAVRSGELHRTGAGHQLASSPRRWAGR